MKNFNQIIIAALIGCCLLFYVIVLANSEKVELKFSHKLHAVDNEMECATCHEAAESSQKGGDNLFPTMETCANCHDVEDDEGCQLCHSDMDNPRAVPRVDFYSELFSHEKHLTTGFDCNSCHRDVKNKVAIESYLLPNMAECMSCHTQKNASIECVTCHKPSERLKPLTHGSNFLHQHGDLARTAQPVIPGAKTCNLCHSINYCQECHEGDNLDRLSHPLNYAFTHSLDARGKEKDCSVCHTERSFCSECHRENLIMPHNHTAGWTNRIPGDGGRHRLEAETDLENCMSCHEADAEHICLTCHSK
jgi:hypothetical protein